MKKILIALFLLAGTIFVFVQMRPTGKKLNTPETRLGILNLEFAYNNYHTSKVLHAWMPEEKITAAKQNTYIDFGLLFFYAFFLFYSCKNLAKKFSGMICNIGVFLSKAAIIAGFLDVIENTGMLVTLGGNQSAAVSLITATCASIKWLLAILGILYIIFTSPVAFYLFIKNKQPVKL